MRRLCIVYKIKTLKIPEYLHYSIPNDHQTYNTRNLDFVWTYFCRTDVFKYSFFPYSISESNKFGPDLHNAKSYSTFRKSLHFLPILFLSRTNLTQACAMLNHTQHSENHYWSLVDQSQIIFTKSMIF